MTKNRALAELSNAREPHEKAAPSASSRGEMATWQARCIEGYIAANLHTTIRMVDLAGVVQWGPYRFRRAFKEHFGCTPHQYVMRRRVERAQRLMMISRDPLSQISAECGFANQFHLSNLFRRIVGGRPAAWRRSLATTAQN